MKDNENFSQGKRWLIKSIPYNQTRQTILIDKNLLVWLEKQIDKPEDLKETSPHAIDSVKSLTTPWERFMDELLKSALIELFLPRGIDIKQYSRVKTKWHYYGN